MTHALGSTHQIVLPPREHDTMSRHLAGEYPDEGCGVLVGVADDVACRVTDVVPCENVAEPDARRRRFSIDPRVVLRLQRELRGTGRGIVGFYHSHPDAEAEPSETDMQYLRLWPRTVWLVVPVRGGIAGEPRAWWLADPDAVAPVELELRGARPGAAHDANPAADPRSIPGRRDETGR